MRAPAGYRYMRHLGAGGFGDVHLAEHVATGRPVAIKYIQSHLLKDPDILARFRREAQILAATDVPTVVRVYDLDTTSDPAHLVMEYVPGVTLWDLMERAPLPAHQALAVLGDVADALRAMAQRGLVHRDIKPSNVFVLPSGRAKLGDFGLARTAVDDGGFRTVGAPAGTPAYFPPEISAGHAVATVQSDAYSFAVMAYEALAGELPITAPDAISLITAHWTQQPRPITEALPGFPPAAAPVLMRALSKSPVGRPLPHELMAALEAVAPAEWPTNDRPPVPVSDAPSLEKAEAAASPQAVETAAAVTGEGFDRSGTAAPTTVVAGSPPIAAHPGPVATSGTTSPPPGSNRDRVRVADRPPGRSPGSRRHRWWGAGAVAALVVGALAVAFWTRDGPQPPPEEARQLAVTSVSLSAHPARTRCPRAEVTLTATITTNGGEGTVAVMWTLPDGSRGPLHELALADGQRQVLATLETTLRGDRPLEGEAVATIRPSTLQAVAPVIYSCGRGGR